jgi:uncharacterized protein (TIRG00374 family)
MKKQLTTLLRVLVSFGILAYLFNSIFQKEAADYFVAHQIDPAKISQWERIRIVWTVGPEHLWEVFQTISVGWFLAGVGFFGIVCWVGTERWRLIMRVQGLELPFRRALSIFFVGHFFNAFMLGATGGDVVKAWYAAKETHHKKTEAVMTVLVDRLIGLLALFVIVLVMMGLNYHRVFDDPKLRKAAYVALIVVVATVSLTVVGFYRSFSRHFPFVRRWLEKMPKFETLRKMTKAYQVYATHPKVVGQTMLLSIGLHMAVMSSVWCIGRGLKLDIPYWDYLLYLPIINTIAAVPITVSGFGVREGMYVVFFGVLIGDAQAISLSLFGYATSLVWSVVGGGFYLTHRHEIPKDATETSAFEEVEKS